MQTAAALERAARGGSRALAPERGPRIDHRSTGTRHSSCVSTPDSSKAFRISDAGFSMQARFASHSRSRGGGERIARVLARAFLLIAGCLFVSAGAARAQATSLDSTATLLWTAPGDDGTACRATRYEMRFRSAPIAGADTASWWSSAAIVSGMPAPGAAGATDSVTVRGLDPGLTWYFVLETADEVPNWSNFSNVAVRGPYVDLVPPAAIADLVAGAVPNRPAMATSPRKTALPSR